jgi:hypothetical protein
VLPSSPFFNDNGEPDVEQPDNGNEFARCYAGRLAESQIGKTFIAR